MIRIGRINTTYQPTTTNFVQFDVIKQDISDNSNIEVGFNKHGSWSITGTPRIKADIEFDFLTRAQLTALKDIVLDSTQPFFLQIHPSTSAMFVDYNGVSNPSSTQKILTTESDSDNLAYGGTEISSANYQNIWDMQQPAVQYVIKNNNTRYYNYVFFKFGPTSYDMTVQQPKRVTFNLYNPWCYDGSNYGGFKIDVLDQVFGTWVELSRINYTMAGTVLDGFNPKKKHFYSSVIRPNKGFSNLVNFHADGYFYFRMRNIFARGAYSNQLGFGYPHLIIDGFPCVLTNPNNFNFRDSFTGTGYTGRLELTEV